MGEVSEPKIVAKKENKALRGEAWKRLEEALKNRGWVRGVCPNCGIVFYGKKQHELCGNERCGEPKLEFKEAKTEIISLEKLSQRAADFFKKEGYRIREPMPLLRWNKDKDAKVLTETIFVVAGVQVLFDAMFSERDPQEELKNVFIAQPSIRLVASQSAGAKYGIYTSFVNICTETYNPTIDDYLRDVFAWLKLLEELLGPDDLRITLADATSNWDGRETTALQNYFYYKSFALGDANFHYAFPQNTRNSITLSDVGLGLERLCCCVNGVSRDFDIIGPYMESVRGNNQLVDRVRTLVLLMGSNLVPSDTPYGMKVRGLVREIIEIDKDYMNWWNLVPYFYAFWSNFTQLELSPQRIRETIRNEINRRINRQIADYLKIKTTEEDTALPTIEFVENCANGTYKKGIPREKVEEAIKSSDLFLEEVP